MLEIVLEKKSRVNIEDISPRDLIFVKEGSKFIGMVVQNKCPHKLMYQIQYDSILTKGECDTLRELMEKFDKYTYYVQS